MAAGFRQTITCNDPIFDRIMMGKNGIHAKGAKTVVRTKKVMLWAFVAGALFLCTQPADAQIFAPRRFGFGGFGGYYGGFGSSQSFYFYPSQSYNYYYSGQVVLPGWSATGTGYPAPRMRATLGPAVNIDELSEDTNIQPAAYAPSTRQRRYQYAPRPIPYVAPRCCYP